MTLEQIIQKAIEDDFGRRGWNKDTYKHGNIYDNVAFKSTDLAHNITKEITANLVTIGELLDKVRVDRERELARDEITVTID
jgi:hypothetical protein